MRVKLYKCSNTPCQAQKRVEALVGESIEEILIFWFYKRKKRSGVPLIRRIQVTASG